MLRSLKCQSSLGKECVYEPSFLSQAGDGQMELLMQLLHVPTHEVTHLHVLEVVPSAFVPGIQIGGVAWQRFQPHLAAGVGHKLLNEGSAVDRRTIPDDQQPL